jgi:DNA-binding HxlR family transcriptional regulator
MNPKEKPQNKQRIATADDLLKTPRTREAVAEFLCISSKTLSRHLKRLNIKQSGILFRPAVEEILKHLYYCDKDKNDIIGQHRI